VFQEEDGANVKETLEKCFIKKKKTPNSQDG
jgi:hypothetical protein